MSKDGLCAIVTGSASGLGAATAAILAKGGARIVVNYSSSQKEAEQTADLCRSAGGEVVVVQGDVSRDEDCKKIVAAAAPWGRLDALINNAGTTKHMAHDNLDGLSAEDFQRLFGVNTIGPFQMVRAARSLLEAGAKASGRASAVVNVSSVAGISGIGSSIAYAASKGALNTITYSLARALAPLIRVNTVCPGYIDTPWFTKGRGEAGAKQVRDNVIAKVPLKVASTADDIAHPGVFSRDAGLEQHDRRTGADGCRAASDYVRRRVVIASASASNPSLNEKEQNGLLRRCAPRNDGDERSNPPLPVARIGNHPPRHQPVPDEQHHQRADRCGDEAGALIGTVMADGLADEGREKRAGNAEHGGQDESAGIVRARRKQPRDDPRDKADDDDPENAAHGCRPFSKNAESQ